MPTKVERLKSRHVQSETPSGRNKLAPNVIPRDFEIVDKQGSRVTIEDTETGKQYQRNSAHLVHVPEAVDEFIEMQHEPEETEREMTQMQHEPEEAEEIKEKEVIVRKSSRPRKPTRRFEDYVR